MSERTSISVIIPIFNMASFIGQAIESVQSQTINDWEMIVVDNCSTDNSRETVDRYAASDSRIKLFRCEYNSGSPARPRNIGIKQASGTYITFLDADDLWLEQKLERQVNFLNDHKEVFLLYARYFFMKNGKITKDKVLPPLKQMKSGRIFKDLFLSDNFIPTLTVMFRNRYENNYLFDEDPGSMEDLDLWLRISGKENIDFINEPLAIYRIHGSSTTSDYKLVFSKYLTLLKKWRKKVGLGVICLKYILFISQMAILILRKVKESVL